ncbi:MAG: hypothetical protein JJU09_12030 [Rhodobacteraceae bacterium]|nr:hypothetical protein [Paracoccaceae bacterium]
MTDVKISARQSFLIQSHEFVRCCVRLGVLEEKQESWIANDVYDDTSRILVERGALMFKGQGFLLGALYLLLVLPLEWKKERVDGFDRLDLSEAEAMANRMAKLRSPADDTYRDKDIALRHLRNALAHGRIDWSQDNLVIEDRDKQKKCKYRAEYSAADLGELAQCLSLAISKYFDNVVMSKNAE